MWTQHWSRKAEAAVIKQARQEPAELRDNRPDKDQGGDVKAGVDDQMKDVQGAAIQSFCRKRTAEALS